jgi:glycosyltransferase involved in cell wall biosynthesis
MKNSDSRVLFLRSNPIAPDPRVEKEACALASSGYPVRVLGWDRTAQLPSMETRSGVAIYRLPLRAKYGLGVQNLPHLLRWEWMLFKWLVLHNQEYDVIHACDFDTVIPALFMKTLWGKRLVYDIFDFYADHLRHTPGWIKYIIRRMDLWVINHADAVILVDDSRRDQISGAHPRRLTVIYNSPEDVLGTLKGEDLHPPGSQLHLAYIGLLQVERGLLEMLEVLRRHPEWTLTLAGFGGDDELILSLAQALPNVAWHGRISYERAIQLSASADVLFATYDPAIPNHRYSSPNKIFEAMMLGKPTVVARGMTIDHIIRQADCGLVVRYGDVEKLEAVLSRLAKEPALRQRLGENGRRAYEATYDWHLMRQRLLALYADLIRTNLS